MSNRFKYRSLPVFLSRALLISNISSGQSSMPGRTGQPTDSMSLKSVIDRVVSTYPTVKVAEETINNSDARIAFAASVYKLKAAMGERLY